MKDRNSPLDDLLDGDWTEWIPTGIMLLAFWPVGLYMLINRLTGSEKRRKQTSAQKRPAYRRYASERQHESNASSGLHDTARDAEYQSVPAAGPRKITNGGLNLITVLGIVLLILGALNIGDGIYSILHYGLLTSLRLDASEVLIPLFFFTGGISCFFATRRIKKRIRRFRKYQYTVGRRKTILIKSLADMVRVPFDQTCDELQEMIDKGYLGKDAYLDLMTGNLVLEPGAAPEQSPEQASEQAHTSVPEDDYADILLQIRTLNDSISDAEVSAKILQIELLSARIFGLVREDPQKLPRLRTFMNYYLPTTLKLLHSYAQFEKQGIEGENISAAKAKIESILDTLVETFRRQLDALFTNDAMDVASDIEVLEQMMARDGVNQQQGGDGLVL